MLEVSQIHFSMNELHQLPGAMQKELGNLPLHPVFVFQVEVSRGIWLAVLNMGLLESLDGLTRSFVSPAKLRSL